MISSHILRKYNIPGPRYTSYPTVPYWSENPSPKQWVQSVIDAQNESERAGIGAAVYVHIPFCRSLCTYCGCNTRITRNQAVGPPYVDALLKEWGLYRREFSRDPLISEVHLGGGTPTFLSTSELDRLVRGILLKARVSAQAEFSVEVDPRVTSREQLAILYQLGFRRISLGVQDFDLRVQETVHRVQSEEEVRQITEWARELGFFSVNYDLIYGLPFQTKQSVETTMSVVRKLKPDRVAFYAYAHVPWIKPSQRRFTDADLPSGEERRALYEEGRRHLEDAGYGEVGMDHFSLPTDSLWKSFIKGELHRNFMGYISRHVAPLIGIGVSAIGDAWTVFSQNEKTLEAYLSRLERDELPLLRGHVLNHEDLILRRHILNLMTKFSTSWDLDQLNIDHLRSVPERLSELARDGLVELTSNSCRVTGDGRAFLRNICMAFDARLSRRNPSSMLFSSTI